MDEIGAIYGLKKNSVGLPKHYSGADTKTLQMKFGIQCWTMSPDSYVREAIVNIELLMENDGKRIKRASIPFPHMNCKPELDTSPLLDAPMMSRYQPIIGIFQWSCELGRFDILLEVSLLSAFNAAPREGHLNALYNIFSYLNTHASCSIAFEPTLPNFDDKPIESKGWEEFYEVDDEPVPKNAPWPCGKPMKMTCFVDVSHASNKDTYKSHTGIFILLNNAPVVWYSERQSIVESSTFGSEFVALRVATELIEGLRYKLRMFGVPIDGAISVYWDKQLVTKNATVPASALSKKHNSICYHKCRESVASG